MSSQSLAEFDHIQTGWCGMIALDLDVITKCQILDMFFHLATGQQKNSPVSYYFFEWKSLDFVIWSKSNLTHGLTV